VKSPLKIRLIRGGGRSISLGGRGGNEKRKWKGRLGGLNWNSKGRGRQDHTMGGLHIVRKTKKGQSVSTLSRRMRLASWTYSEPRSRRRKSSENWAHNSAAASRKGLQILKGALGAAIGLTKCIKTCFKVGSSARPYIKEDVKRQVGKKEKKGPQKTFQ